MDTPDISNDFASLAEAKQAFSELEISSQSLLNEANEKISSLTTDLGLANERADMVTSDFERTSEQLESAKASLAAAQSEIAELKATAKTAEQIGAQMAASVGIAPVQVATIGSTASGTLSEQYAAITDPLARSRFFQANKDALIAEKKMFA